MDDGQVATTAPLAFATTLARHRDTLSRGSRAPKALGAMDDRVLRKAILRAEEDQANDSTLEDAQHEAVDIVSELALPLTHSQRDTQHMGYDLSGRQHSRPIAPDPWNIKQKRDQILPEGHRRSRSPMKHGGRLQRGVDQRETGSGDDHKASRLERGGERLSHLRVVLSSVRM